MINDLDTNLASPKIGLSQFADDSGLWRAGNPSNHQHMAELQTSLNNIGKWADKWGFKLSHQKKR